MVAAWSAAKVSSYKSWSEIILGLKKLVFTGRQMFLNQTSLYRKKIEGKQH